jgi:hypothetical protein
MHSIQTRTIRAQKSVMGRFISAHRSLIIKDLQNNDFALDASKALVLLSLQDNCNAFFFRACGKVLNWNRHLACGFPATGCPTDQAREGTRAPRGSQDRQAACKQSLLLAQCHL